MSILCRMNIHDWELVNKRTDYYGGMWVVSKWYQCGRCGKVKAVRFRRF